MVSRAASRPFFAETAETSSPRRLYRTFGGSILTSQATSIVTVINRVAGEVISAVTVATVPTEAKRVSCCPIIGCVTKEGSPVPRESPQSTRVANSGRMPTFYMYRVEWSSST